MPSQDSVRAESAPGGVLPPKIIELVESEAVPPVCDLALFKSPTSVHDEPSQVSVIARGAVVRPPASIALVVVPPPLALFLAVFKSPVSVQPLPFHISVKASYPGL